jgi:hypothetical protein
MAGSRSGVPSLSVIKATPLIVHTRIYMRGRGDRRLQINAPDVWRRSCCYLPPEWRNPISRDCAAECKPDNWQKSEREKPDTAPSRGKEATIKNGKSSVVTLENKPPAHTSTGKKCSFLEVPTRKRHTDYCYKTDTTRRSNHQNGRAAGCDESCITVTQNNTNYTTTRKMNFSWTVIRWTESATWRDRTQPERDKDNVCEYHRYKSRFTYAIFYLSRCSWFTVDTAHSLKSPRKKFKFSRGTQGLHSISSLTT